MADNPVPAGNEIQRPDETDKEQPNPLVEQYIRSQDARTTGDRQTVGFTPQDGAGIALDKGFDARLGYDRIAVGATPLGQRIDNITNLLAAGERASGNLRDVNQYYGKAQNMADALFVEASTNVMQRREDYAKVLTAKTPQEALSLVQDSVNKQGQALVAERQQTTDQRRAQELDKLIIMAQERAQTLERMKTVSNPQELNRLLMYDALSAQRIDLKKGILNEKDPAEARKMTEAELNLHTVQRAPGFTRANYGMLMMRMGQFDPTRPDNVALRALQDAASVDPEMVPNPKHPDPMRRMGDPNFMRAAADISGLRPDDPKLQQALAPIFNRTDANRVPQPIYRPEDNGGAPLMDGKGNVRYSQTDGVQPPQPGLEGTRDQTVISDQTRQGVTALVNNLTPFERVQELGKRVPTEGLTADIRNGYASAIGDSDKGTSPRVAELQQRMAQFEQKAQTLAQQIEAIKANPGADITALVAQGKQSLDAKTPAQKQEFVTLMQGLSKAQSKEERDAVLGKMNAICPEFVKVTQLLEAKLKPATDQLEALQKEAAPIQNALIGEMNQSSSTRMEYAEKLIAGGKPEDVAAAKQLLIESVAKAMPEQKEAFKQYAMRLGLTEQELAQGLGKVEVATPGKPTVQPPADASATSKLIEENRKAFDAAPDKAAALKQMDAQFKKAITDADKDFTDAEAKFKAAQTKHTELSAAVPQADKDKFAKMNAATTPEAEKVALGNELATKYANIVQLEAEMTQIQASALDLSLNKFAARFDYSRANSLSGNDAAAKPLMEDALRTLGKDVGPEIVTEVLKDKEVQDLSTKLGVDAAALAKQAAESVTATDGAAARGKDPQELIDLATKRMKDGDTAGAKQAYEEAIKNVDARVNTEANNAKIKSYQDALESGTMDGKQLTVEDRVLLHQQIALGIQDSMGPYSIRRNYGLFLASNNQNAAAEPVFKDAVKYADAVPVDLMQREAKLIAADTSVVQTAFEQATGERRNNLEQAGAGLSKISDALTGRTDDPNAGSAADRSWVNTPITARKELASFYVRLLPERDENGKPMVNPDGSPRYLADPGKVFKPQEAMTAIDEAKALHKKIHGTDLDADPARDPGLAELAKAVYDNSPAELQRKYANVSRFWHESVAMVPSSVIGTATALLTAAAMAKIPGVRALGPLARTAAIWTPALAAGTLTAAGTRQVVMHQFGRTDESWGKSLALGGGATVGGVLLFKAPQIMHRNVQAENVTALLAKNGVGDDLLATQLFNKGLSSGKQVTSLSEALVGMTGPQRAAAAQRVLEFAKTEAAAVKLVSNGVPMAESLATTGLKVSDDVAAHLQTAGIAVNKVEGVSSVALNTVDDLYTVLPKLAESNPALFNAKNAAEAGKKVEEMLRPFGLDKGKSLKDVMTAASNAGLKDVDKLNVLRQLVPDLAEAGQVGRFTAARQAIAERKFMAALAETGKGTVKLGVDGVKGTFNGVREFGTAPFRAFENQTAAGIGRQRFLSGSLGGAGYYAGNNYPAAWNEIASGNVDPSTGKPYEFSFSNAIVRPAWKSNFDNIFTSSLLVGGFMAQPGYSVVAQAPWANSGRVMGTVKGGFGLLTGSTPLYWGAKGGELGTTLASNFVLGQWGMAVNSEYATAGTQYTDALNAINKPIVDGITPANARKAAPPKVEQPAAVVPPEKKEKKPDVPNANPGPENPDLTGGVK